MPKPTNNLEQVELKDFLLSLVDQILIPPETKATENVKVGYDFEYLLKELTKYQHQLTQEARIDELQKIAATALIAGEPSDTLKLSTIKEAALDRINQLKANPQTNQEDTK